MLGPSGTLLTAIRTAVLADEAPPGLAGCVRIGVAYPTGDCWLEVRFKETSAEAGAPRPGDVDVSLLLGDYEAKRLLRGRALPHAPLFSVQGDSALLDRFFDRYRLCERWAGLRVRPGQPS